jgi:hypothetical protein
VARERREAREGGDEDEGVGMGEGAGGAGTSEPEGVGSIDGHSTTGNEDRTSSYACEVLTSVSSEITFDSPKRGDGTLRSNELDSRFQLV